MGRSAQITDRIQRIGWDGGDGLRAVGAAKLGQVTGPAETVGQASGTALGFCGATGTADGASRVCAGVLSGATPNRESTSRAAQSRYWST